MNPSVFPQLSLKHVVLPERRKISHSFSMVSVSKNTRFPSLHAQLEPMSQEFMTGCVKKKSSIWL